MCVCGGGGGGNRCVHVMISLECSYPLSLIFRPPSFFNIKLGDIYFGYEANILLHYFSSCSFQNVLAIDSTDP